MAAGDVRNFAPEELDATLRRLRPSLRHSPEASASDGRL